MEESDKEFLGYFTSLAEAKDSQLKKTAAHNLVNTLLALQNIPSAKSSAIAKKSMAANPNEFGDKISFDLGYSLKRTVSSTCSSSRFEVFALRCPL
jgi:cytochrome c peroxidase